MMKLRFLTLLGVLTVLLLLTAASASAELTPKETKKAEALIQQFSARQFDLTSVFPELKAPGSYTLRGGHANYTRWRTGDWGGNALSNPVEIEILPAKERGEKRTQTVRRTSTGPTDSSPLSLDFIPHVICPMQNSLRA